MLPFLRQLLGRNIVARQPADQYATDKLQDSIIVTMKGVKIFKGNDRADFQHWLQVSLIPSCQRPDMFNIVGGKERPVAMGDTSKDAADRAGSDKANQDVHTSLLLITEKAASLLATNHSQKHPWDPRKWAGCSPKTRVNVHGSPIRTFARRRRPFR